MTSDVIAVTTSEDADSLRKAFAEDFRDKARLKMIVKADANRVSPVLAWNLV